LPAINGFRDIAVPRNLKFAPNTKYWMLPPKGGHDQQVGGGLDVTGRRKSGLDTYTWEVGVASENKY
jgi:hypothetical protein